MTIGCAGLGWLCAVAVRKESMLKDLGMRVGVGFGLMVYVLILNLVFGNGRIKSPENYNTAS